MFKLTIILFSLFYCAIASANSNICFKGRANFDFVDSICFDKDQVELYKVDSHNSEMLQVKILNVDQPIFIYAKMESFKKKLK